MFTTLDVLTGLAFVYLVLALVVTALTEWASSATRLRAKNLRKAIEQMLDGGTGATANSDRFYNHPRIVAISEGHKKPSYIPARTFVDVLQDLLTREKDPIKKEEVPVLAGPAAQIAATDLEERFIDTMNRATGWYKRRTLTISALAAVVVVVAANADTLSIAGTLWTSPTVRAAAVAQAQRRVAMGSPRRTVEANYENQQQPVPGDSDESAETSEADTVTEKDRAVLDQLLGWGADYKRLNDAHCRALQQQRDEACRERGDEATCNDVLAKIAADNRCQLSQGSLTPTDAYPTGELTSSVMTGLFVGHLFGWLLSIAAVSLGAPFWFDTLSRIVNVRGSGPPEKPTDPSDQSKGRTA